MFKESNLLLELLIITTGKSIYILRHKFQLAVVQVNHPAASVAAIIMPSISRSRRASIPATDLAASTRLALDPVGCTKCQQDHRHQEG